MIKTIDENQTYVRGMEFLVEVVQRLSLARSLPEIVDITRHAARELTGADGASFVLRDNDLCYYLDEDAIEPMWKGSKFPINSCVSGWVMTNGQSIIVEDIFNDRRIPVEVYRPTFVKSLAMVPIRMRKPIGAIGNYWATRHHATEDQMRLLKALADATSVALENVQLVTDLEKANTSLNESLRARDEFLSVASHELRTPLSSLKLQLQLLGRDINVESGHGPPLDKQKKANDLALRQVSNLNHLIENLLDVSRLRLQRLALDITKFDFSQLVLHAIEQYRPQFASAGCELTVNLEDNLWGDWDETRLLQTFSNLFSNAIKYAPGKPVHVSTYKSHDMAFLVVKDHGPGIAANKQEKIFECFERGVSPDNVSGLGLGLFITRRLVDAHRGQVFLKSKEGQGATFTLQFPCSPDGDAREKKVE